MQSFAGGVFAARVRGRDERIGGRVPWVIDLSSRSTKKRVASRKSRILARRMSRLPGSRTPWVRRSIPARHRTWDRDGRHARAPGACSPRFAQRARSAIRSETPGGVRLPNRTGDAMILPTGAMDRSRVACARSLRCATTGSPTHESSIPLPCSAAHCPEKGERPWNWRLGSRGRSTPVAVGGLVPIRVFPGMRRIERDRSSRLSSNSFLASKRDPRPCSATIGQSWSRIRSNARPIDCWRIVGKS